jgi:hypothetical protein
MKALGDNTNVPVPKVYTLCEDVSIIGTPFYVSNFDVNWSETVYSTRRLAALLLDKSGGCIIVAFNGFCTTEADLDLIFLSLIGHGVLGGTHLLGHCSFQPTL